MIFRGIWKKIETEKHTIKAKYLGSSQVSETDEIRKKDITMVKHHGSSQVSETKRTWKSTLLRWSNMVLLRYLRQMEYNKDVAL